MKISEARTTGELLARQVSDDEIDAAISLLNPILTARTPFSALNIIGGSLENCPLENIYIFLNKLAFENHMGGWVVTGSALGAQLDRDFNGAFTHCKRYIIDADTWYGSDILGERVPGPALLYDFKCAINNLLTWRDDPNRWVRRATGVSVHFWAKKTRGSDQHVHNAIELLNFLTPMFAERELDAAKGIGWGLKTLGKYYPEILTNWLMEILTDQQLNYRAIMVRKSITYLPVSTQSEILSLTR
jgi:hypothetical protein